MFWLIACRARERWELGALKKCIESDLPTRNILKIDLVFFLLLLRLHHIRSSCYSHTRVAGSVSDASCCVDVIPVIHRWVHLKRGGRTLTNPVVCSPLFLSECPAEDGPKPSPDVSSPDSGHWELMWVWFFFFRKSSTNFLRICISNFVWDFEYQIFGFRFSRNLFKEFHSFSDTFKK